MEQQPDNARAKKRANRCGRLVVTRYPNGTCSIVRPDGSFWFGLKKHFRRHVDA